MPITLVQHAIGNTQFNSGTSGTGAAAFGSNTTAGNCLIAAFTIQTQNKSFSTSISSVNTQGSAEHWASVVSDTGEAFSVSAIWVDPNTSGGASVINVNIAFGATASTSETVTLLVDLYEVSGIVASSPADKTSGNDDAGTGGTSWTSNASATTTIPIEFWVGVASGNVGASNTTTTVTGPGGSWTNETTLTNSNQAGGVGAANKFFSYQKSGFQITSSTGAATYNGTFANTSFWSACVATLKSTQVGATFFQSVNEVRARIPRTFSKGRVYKSTRTPVINPTQGPVFRQLNRPVQAKRPLFRTGRVFFREGPVPRNPVPGPVFFQPVTEVRARIPQTFSRGRVSGNKGAPVRNPTQGPIFRQATSPVRARQPLPIRGRITFNDGAPNIPMIIGPKFTPFRQAVRIRVTMPPRGRSSGGRGAPVINPTQGPVFHPFNSPVRIHATLPAAGRVNSHPGGPVKNGPRPPNFVGDDTIVPLMATGVYSNV